MKNWITILVATVTLASCAQIEGRNVSSEFPTTTAVNYSAYDGDTTGITTDEYWKDSLTAEEFHILREHGTERAFTGTYLPYKGKGTFVCRACKLPLFSGETKFKSGTGWPSFFNHVGDNVEFENDNSYGMVRTEIHCARCKGHLGHIFEDGPAPTGQRYCVNSLSILLDEK